MNLAVKANGTFLKWWS